MKKPAAQKSLKVGDRVEWETSQGTTTGRVRKKLTAPRQIKTHQVKASPANPEYLVETEGSHQLAAHKPGALKKVGAK